MVHIKIIFFFLKERKKPKGSLQEEKIETHQDLLNGSPCPVCSSWYWSGTEWNAWSLGPTWFHPSSPLIAVKP